MNGPQWGLCVVCTYVVTLVEVVIEDLLGLRPERIILVVLQCLQTRQPPALLKHVPAL